MMAAVATDGTARHVTCAPVPAPVLEVEALKVTFALREGELAAVRDVGLSVARGEIFAIVGESGSGKSLFLRALLRLLPAGATMAGRVSIDGVAVSELPHGELRQVRGRLAGMVFQDPLSSLEPMATIEEQIAEAIHAHRLLDPAATRRRVLELLDQVELPRARERLGAYPHELSGGQRQRVGIALALSGEPKVLLADEPTTALDVSVQARVLALLRDLRQALGTTIVIVTHDIGVVSEVADRVAVMYAGRFVEGGAVDQVLDQPTHPYARALIGAYDGVRRRERPLMHIPGSPPRATPSLRGCAFAPRCRERMARCAGETPPLRRGAAGQWCECWIEP